MASHRRRATYEATLIHVNEPQLILLQSQKNRVIAVAIPTNSEGDLFFLATTVTPINFERYMDGHCDLRYLFSFASKRILYYFNLMEMRNNEVMMSVYSDPVPEQFLPMPRIFSSHHTEDYKIPGRARDDQKLFIDGEWEMPELGRFQSKYSDVYAFIAAAENWQNDQRSHEERREIREVFLDRPFKGGFSYVHFYDDLVKILPRDEKLGLDSITYNSPGEVNIVGSGQLLTAVETVVRNFIDNKSAAKELYGNFRKYLSSSKFLSSSGKSYPKDDPTAPFIVEQSKKLNELLKGPNFDTIYDLADQNALVVAKIILSFYRRIEESATFFAEGRMNYTPEGHLPPSD